ncbi:MAG: hypothetical protein E8D46_14990 [Nitrospira sp.]|nr:MAG: hypothetical protein E8D46_14990 [Nitrospira sp.]
MAPPCVAVKERLVGLAPIEGGTGASAMVSVTGTVIGAAPEALKVMAPLWLPAVKPPMFTVMVMDPFPVPEAGATVNQVTLSLALQPSEPPPTLLILTA